MRMRAFIFNCALLQVESKQLKHCYDDRAKTLSHKISALTSNTINFVVENN